MNLYAKAAEKQMQMNLIFFPIWDEDRPAMFVRPENQLTQFLFPCLIYCDWQIQKNDFNEKHKTRWFGNLGGTAVQGPVRFVRRVPITVGLSSGAGAALFLVRKNNKDEARRWPLISQRSKCTSSTLQPGKNTCLSPVG